MPEAGGESRKLRAIFLMEKGIDLDELEDAVYVETVNAWTVYQKYRKDFLINALKEFPNDITLLFNKGLAHIQLKEF